VAAGPVRLRVPSVPKTASTTRCAVAFGTPAAAANAAMPAALLPPARFAATRPDSSRLTLMPADDARAVMSRPGSDLPDAPAPLPDFGVGELAPQTGATIRCAVAFGRPVAAANAAMPAVGLPPAGFAARSPAASRLR